MKKRWVNIIIIPNNPSLVKNSKVAAANKIIEKNPDLKYRDFDGSFIYIHWKLSS